MATLRVKFSSPDKAKDFADRFGIVGLSASLVREGNAIRVSSEDPRSLAFVRSMVRDIQETNKAEAHIARFVLAVKQSAVSGSPIPFVLLDSTQASITPDFARQFLTFHARADELVGKNFCLVAIESKDSHDKAVRFIGKNT